MKMLLRFKSQVWGLRWLRCGNLILNGPCSLVSISSVGVIQVKRADVPNPQDRHWFISDGKTFYIARDGKDPIAAVDELTWEIKITADERATSWRT